MSVDTNLHVRIPQWVKAELDAKAAGEGLTLNEYMNKHLEDLFREGKIEIAPKGATSIQIRNPWASPAMQPGMSGYVPDVMDQALNEMRKMFLMKMFRDMLREDSASTPERYFQMMQGRGSMREKDDFSMADMMKMQMMQNQQAMQQRENERSMMMMQQQLESARSRGDKGGEDKITQLMMAMLTGQSTQQQNWTQQFLAANQSASNAQTNLFQTALQSKSSSDENARSQEREMQGQIEKVRDQFMAAQMQTLQSMNQMTINQLNIEMQRIRNEQPKDTIKQMAELISLRDANPVYKAAFDAAFGVKNEGTLGKLIPQLKELGVDKLVERVGGFLWGMVSPPKIPAPGAPGAGASIPAPSPPSLPTVPVPGPSAVPGPVPLGQNLEQLRLPGPSTPASTTPASPTQPTTKFTATPQPPENLKTSQDQLVSSPDSSIGYTNLDVERRDKEVIPVKVKAEAQEEQQTPPPS